jgi:hypothetical protein
MTVPGLVGIDPLALDDLIRLLERTAEQVLQHRLETERLLVQLGMSPEVARRLREVEDWLYAVSTQAKRRRDTIEEPVRQPRPSLDGATLLLTRTGRPTFAEDALSGIGLSGYAGIGLSYRHLGVQTRTVTRTWSYGDGWMVTEKRTERRGVFEVEPGLGWENIEIISFGARRWYNPWTTAGTTFSYSHHGVPATAAEWARAGRGS